MPFFRPHAVSSDNKFDNVKQLIESLAVATYGTGLAFFMVVRRKDILESTLCKMENKSLYFDKLFEVSSTIWVSLCYTVGFHVQTYTIKSTI